MQLEHIRRFRVWLKNIMNKSILKVKVNWGWLVYSLFSLIQLINFFFFYFFYSIIYSANSYNILSSLFIVLLIFLPIFVLNAFFNPVNRSILLNFIWKEKTECILYKEGIKLKRNFLVWNKIKSISFQSGRPITDYSFYKGIKLPALQRLFILDKKGEEYSCIIDIDYFFKQKRGKNNILLFREALVELGKSHLISDWAEKR